MNYTKIFDISWPIEELMTAYKDKKVVSVTATKSWEQHHARESLVQLGTHTGTHVDMPSHFVEHGQTLDQLDIKKLVGPCVVIDCMHVDDCIMIDDIPSDYALEDRIILFKTKNSLLSSTDAFVSNFVYLSAQTAAFLAQKNVRAVGIDYLGIERNQPEHETHLKLLEKAIPIIEGLRLIEIDPGEYFFCCLPLALKGLEAAPARAILMR